jgi:ferredoxin/rubrerythrin
VSNVTFSSPVMARDVTAYAVAGDRGTILAVAKAHKVPIPFECQDGECGSCLVEVTHFVPENKCAIALTEKEKDLLRQLGKITTQEIQNAEVNDMPPRYRLACQCFIRNEDILVTFEGDQTLQPPHLSIAARIFKGGIQLTSVDDFLGFAVKVEEDAAFHFEELVKAMEQCGNQDVAHLFAQLGHVSRLRAAKARKRAALADGSKHVPTEYLWPDTVTPERTALWAGDQSLSRLGALRAALQGERRGYEFYCSVAGTCTDPDICALAKELVIEEAEHVEVLKAWLTREEWQLRAQP